MWGISVGGVGCGGEVVMCGGGGVPGRWCVDVVCGCGVWMWCVDVVVMCCMVLGYM